MKFLRQVFWGVALICCLSNVTLMANAEDIFHSSDALFLGEDYILEVDTENYLFVGSSDNNLHVLDKNTGLASLLIDDVSNFITDGNTVYYDSTDDDSIYRINVDGTGNELIYSGVTSVVGCWNNKYLYYYQYSESGTPEYSTWMLDLENHSTKMILPENTSDFQVCNGKLYYTVFNGDNPFSDLYVSELDGSNPYILMTDIDNFEIIDNQIYYAKSNVDYGYGVYKFYIAKCDLSGGNTQTLVDNILSSDITSIRKDKCAFDAGSAIDYVEYTSQNEIGVLLNGAEIKFDQPPVIVDGRTLVPIRAVIESMSGKVDWNGETQTVSLTLGSDAIKLIIGSTTAYLNGEAKTLDVPPQIINGRTLLPIRFIAEGFAFNVDWDGNARTVIITSDSMNTELVYKNEKMGYQLTLPESYRGYYRIHEYDHGGVNICFYGNSNTARNYPESDYFPGIPIFMVLPEDVVEADEFLDGVTKIGTVNGTEYYYATGTGFSLGYLYDSLNYVTDSNEKAMLQADVEKAKQMNEESANVVISEISSDDSTKGAVSGTYTDVTNTMSDSLLDEFNAFVCAEARTAEVAPYNILASYDCNGNNNIRDLMWYFMTEYANVYLANRPNFNLFENNNVEFFSDDELLRVPSYLLDMVIKEYYNISAEIPEFEKISGSEYDAGTLYYSNYYYFYNNIYLRVTHRYRSSHNYKAVIENIYDLGDNRYYFKYKLGTGLIGSNADTIISDTTYHAVMERKTLNNESFTNLEFWSVLKTSTEEINVF